ncbi:TPA: IS3 family transposase, partial [Staphylococcus aureus]
KWVTDVTELILENGRKFYLSAIRDLGTGKIVSYDISYSNNNQLVFNTFNKALKKVKNISGLILHSDRGFQYTSKHFKFLLDEQGVIQSMSRVGRCIDNSPMESFWGIMKSEIYRGNRHYKFKDIKTARSQFKEYIDFYNNERITLEMERLIA